MEQLVQVQVEQALKQYFGYDTFLPGQQHVINLVLAGRDALVLMPTGGGKSLTYQLPALLLPGVTVVISPLISLMQDQVDRLQANGIAASFINSSLSQQERYRRERVLVNGELKLVYVAPERALQESFLMLLDEVDALEGLSLLAVDEAHCVSEWGHDFRPEYRQLWRLRTRYEHTPMLALTATATERVREDILTQLKLHDPHVHIASFNRPNLSYEVRQKQQGSYREIVQFLREHPDASVIIYCLSRNNVDTLCTTLKREGINALPYHAGLSNEDRSENQARFIRDDVPVLVATIAFGMGIAKPDVRAVIHYDLPRSLEGYYQESGRAGRDGLPADCILFFNAGDRVRLEFTIAARASEQEQLIARQQLQQVVSYCEGLVCRRKVLLAYFGETFPDTNCGKCDVCVRQVEVEDRTIDAQKFLSCVARTRERFGMRHIIDVLRGANTQKIRSFEHDQLSTYGIGRNLSVEEWQHIGRSLVQQGLVSELQDGYPILRLNALSKEILRKQRAVEIPVFASKKQVAVVRSEKEQPLLPTMDAETAGLFHALRLLRKAIADELGVAPYIVFTDVSLHAMAIQRPQSERHFALLPGVGKRKLEAYFAAFTQVIRDYCTQHHLEMEKVPPEEEQPQRSSTVQSVSSGPPTRQVTLALFEEGLSIEEIAKERNLKTSTIASHLAELIEAGEQIDVDRLLSPERYQTIVAAIEQVEENALKPVKELLGENYSYEDIRIARAILRQRFAE